jgi:hypothetical protein
MSARAGCNGADFVGRSGKTGAPRFAPRNTILCVVLIVFTSWVLICRGTRFLNVRVARYELFN